jgi:P-type Cu+ transporter
MAAPGVGATEIDPVCGMAVDPARAKATVAHLGKTFYFCCSGCAETFRADPAKYLLAKVPNAAPLVQLGTAQPRPSVSPHAAKASVYVCPMDPEVREDHPGACPKCGMALEPEIPTADEGENPELVSMTRRFWVSLALTIPVLALGMSDLIPGQPVQHMLSARAIGWIEFLLATPVVVWAGAPFFERGWASLTNRSLNMFTLIALGTGTAWVYSVIAVLFPGIFPASFRM